MSTHNIPYQYTNDRKSPKIVRNTILYIAMGFFARDSRTRSK